MLFSLLILVIAYKVYVWFVMRNLGVDPSIPSPANKKNDCVDYVPTKPGVLFGNQFAAIAAAGPIVCLTLDVQFGYLLIWLWIILNVIFIGAVHDFTALVAVDDERESMHTIVSHGIHKFQLGGVVSTSVIVMLSNIFIG